MTHPVKHVQVAIIGAGPAGIGVAIGLKRQGLESVLILERQHEIGGIPALYKKKTNTVPTFILWKQGRIVVGEEYVRILRDRLSEFEIETITDCLALNIETKTRRLEVASPVNGLQIISAKAVVFACGAREKTLTERGFAAGARPQRIYFTKHLLDLIDQNDQLPVKKPVIIGSDLIAYAAAAKLKAAGVPKSVMVDIARRPRCSWPARLYFRRWDAPDYSGSVKSLKIEGPGIPSQIILATGEMIPCDSVVVSGELVPNSELALLGNLSVELPSRKPVISEEQQLSESGWFAAGNFLGGFHGAEWCYHNGLRVARSVLKFLSESTDN